MQVVFFHRKSASGYFSIESLFRRIRLNLPREVIWKVCELRFASKGFFKRLYIGVEAFFRQGQINHITGDVNFIALFLSKRKTILTIHDVGFMMHSNALYRFLLQWFWIIIPVKRAAFITTVSEASKKELMKYVNVNPNKIKVIYVPISDQFKYEPKEFNTVEPCILQVGTKSNKNISRLIKALEEVPCRLEIVGEVKDSLVKELKTSNIKYTISKNLSDAQLLAKYRSADIVSFVSTYEGFGMPIVEANTIGRVVVTSNILSMPEIAGDSAYLVDPYDVSSIRAGFLKVICDKDYRSRLLENGLKNKDRFQIGEIVKQYTLIYKTISGE